MADRAAGTTPWRTPSRPACTAATTPVSWSASRIGTQSATSTQRTRPRRGGHEGVGGGHRARLRAVDDRDPGAVHLVHPDQPVLGHPELAGDPAAVGGDVGRVVAHVVAEVERVVRGTGPAAPPVGHDPAGSDRRRSGRGATYAMPSSVGGTAHRFRNSGMSSSSSKSSLDSGRRPETGPGIGGSGGTVMPPPVGACAGRRAAGAGVGCRWPAAPAARHPWGRRAAPPPTGGPPARSPDGGTAGARPRRRRRRAPRYRGGPGVLAGAGPAAVEAGRDHGDPHLVTQGVVDDGAEDDVGVGVRRVGDQRGGLVDLEQPEVRAARDRQQHAVGALHRGLQQRAGDRLLGGQQRPVVTARAADAHQRRARPRT